MEENLKFERCNRRLSQHYFYLRYIAAEVTSLDVISDAELFFLVARLFTVHRRSLSPLSNLLLPALCSTLIELIISPEGTDATLLLQITPYKQSSGGI